MMLCDISFDTSDDNENYVDNDVNYNIEEEEVTSEENYEVDEDVDVPVNSNSDSIYKILAGRVLCAWLISKSPAEINFDIVGWDISVQP